MIHSWDTKGLLAAERNHIAKHAKRPPKIELDKLNGAYFRHVLYGHMAHLKSVRGEDDVIYLRFCERLAEIDPTPPRFIQEGKERFEVFDFFICHASEDKDSVARPLEAALTEASVVTFLDEKYVKWGDSFVEKINKAIGRSKYVIAVFSPNSIRKHWPLREINAVLASEQTKGNRLLPLMVGSEEEIREYLQEMPLIADRLYERWTGDPESVVEKALELLEQWTP